MVQAENIYYKEKIGVAPGLRLHFTGIVLICRKSHITLKYTLQINWLSTLELVKKQSVEEMEEEDCVIRRGAKHYLSS